jgi:hypothetical protein
VLLPSVMSRARAVGRYTRSLRLEISQSGRLTPPPMAGSVSGMAVFPVPRYLAETARRDREVHDWIAGLAVIVADLAGLWSLQVGKPFQPGGQCSWTAPVAGPHGARLVLKVAFRFAGGEERDEAAGLRVWHGNGTDFQGYGHAP